MIIHVYKSMCIYIYIQYIHVCIIQIGFIHFSNLGPLEEPSMVQARQLRSLAKHKSVLAFWKQPLHLGEIRIKAKWIRWK